jgi:hypothetical protein
MFITVVRLHHHDARGDGRKQHAVVVVVVVLLLLMMMTGCRRQYCKEEHGRDRRSETTRTNIVSIKNHVRQQRAYILYDRKSRNNILSGCQTQRRHGAQMVFGTAHGERQYAATRVCRQV